ncbi:MAG: hypothetical protein AUH89_01525 [Ktedonobacter sp. 13_1_40CM_4_52_4]|nr:MAG: hypothetical protein AUH89_01525 [Ktedonobacter sp. 13_1_40CM_4_52_4]
MLHTSTPQSLQNTTEAVAKERRRTILVISLVIIETTLVMLALVPPQLWTRLLPNSTSAAVNGPFPPVIAPFITILLYLLPTIIGFLCFSWQQALLYATLPAWIGLGVFLVAATFKVGPFYLLSPDHVTANLSLLELFAALGALGWLGRHLIKLK